MQNSANAFESSGGALHLLGQQCLLGLTPRDQRARMNTSDSRSSNSVQIKLCKDSQGLSRSLGLTQHEQINITAKFCTPDTLC